MVKKAVKESSRKCQDLNLCFEFESDTVNCLDIILSGDGFKFLSDVAYMLLKGALRAVGSAVAYPVKDCVSADGTARISHKNLQDCALGPCKGYLRILKGCGKNVCIKSDVSCIVQCPVCAKAIAFE